MEIKQVLTSGILIGGFLLPSSVAYSQNTQNEKSKVYVVADAHLDTQWNWDIQKTIKEYVWNTINQNLFLLKKYPDYVFNFEGGVKYSWMKEYYPREYEELKKYIKSGRWHISGSSWEASDALVPSVESFIRNIMLGQTYYRQEFGEEGTDIFLPDCFGFGWTLPTIANHCGLIGFSSQKLDWRVNPFYGDSKHPFTIGLWKGIDGSSIMLAHGYGYGKRWDDVDLSNDKELSTLVKRSPLNKLFRYYGTGDMGGSPTLESVSSVEKGIKGDGPLQIISATSDQLFKDYQPYSSHPELPSFDGELLMDVHGTGCYTSQATMKLYNRQNELLGDAAERASVAAEWLGMSTYPKKTLTESWKRFLFHQFHDDLTGTSIPRAYEFSWNDELLSLKQFSGVLSSAVADLSERLDTKVSGIPVVLCNALGFESTQNVELHIKSKTIPAKVTILDASGNKVPSQILSYKDNKVNILVQATVPANGFSVYDVQLTGRGSQPIVNIATTQIENSVYKIVFDKFGDIVSLIDKKNNKELVKSGKAIRLAMFEDNKSYSWPAWEVLKSTVDQSPVSIGQDVKIIFCENGTLRKAVCIEKRHGESLFRQYVRLYEGKLANRIDFYNEIDWKSAHSLLKAEFPLNIENEKATYDLGVGSVQRGNNTKTAYEVYSHYWADMTDKSGDYGVSVLNDCKYGWDKPDNNTFRLTLLHTPETKRNYAYQNRQDFGFHSFTYSIIGHNGVLDKVAVRQDGEELNQAIKGFVTTSHKGELGRSFSFASSDNKNVLIKAIKKAECSDEYVVRVYETSGIAAQKANIIFAGDLESAVEADGTEKNLSNANFSGSRLEVSIKPNSIKTYKIRLKKYSNAIVSNRKYEVLSIPYNKSCFSWNEFRKDADFESGYSFAAELLPESLTVEQIPFKLEIKELKNGLLCKGDTLKFSPQNKSRRLYILAAAATDGRDVNGQFGVDKKKVSLTIPSYTGFIGQWEHENHTKGFLKDADVAYIGTHRHSSDGDHAYEFTYMFKLAIDIPKNVSEICLPNNKDIVIFAATLADTEPSDVEVTTTLFRTNNKSENLDSVKDVRKHSVLSVKNIIGWSGFVNNSEKPEMLVDGKEDTKWCDVSLLPNYVDFDLGEEKKLSSWRLLSAASEDGSYITGSCFLMGKNKQSDEWQSLDYVVGNKKNVIDRSFENQNKFRYLRLMVVQPDQSVAGGASRIYELEVFE
ncbi:glycoside hydrolase family 38 C-terminal domain-containing protein [Phocaeicola paurosaccharolyticus]|uniref:glycoside hydrolase family 38 N-terminal domain-containing protein n=1 Tax=Phocaeicola paurosaccharolyticus TaxID=732242 RepID=UPI00046AB59F|nr:glycoside hydrolase family 38 C-terminal domain-containing protein [Phocaeicola paurosaccharolyticus]